MPGQAAEAAEAAGQITPPAPTRETQCQSYQARAPGETVSHNIRGAASRGPQFQRTKGEDSGIKRRRRGEGGGNQPCRRRERARASRAGCSRRPAKEPAEVAKLGPEGIQHLRALRSRKGTPRRLTRVGLEAKGQAGRDQAAFGRAGCRGRRPMHKAYRGEAARRRDVPRQQGAVLQRGPRRSDRHGQRRGGRGKQARRARGRKDQ